MTAGATLVDKEHPWPGLVPFDENAQGFFFGRDNAKDDLVRMVERDVGVTLFGRSGLGKTSLLHAGVFPALRARGFLPVAIRLSYHAEHIDLSSDPTPAARQTLDGATGAVAPDLVLQIAQRLFHEFDKVDVPCPALDRHDDLWSYLHRADVRTVVSEHAAIPVLVFDQFEELFTRGMTDPTKEKECLDVLDLVAGLIQGRIPAFLRDRIETDPAILANYRLDEPGYRIVIALREDYLSYLEELNARAPMFNRSRFRLLPMSPADALCAVSGPGGDLVDDTVARLIISLLSGDKNSSVTDAEIDPAILSLFCRELNGRRLAKGASFVEASLVSGQRDEILETFYERCFEDVPANVRDLVERELITDDGIRVELSLDNALRATGASRAAFERLATRRLLRIEERRGSARIELVHDVLADPVRRSRERRMVEAAEIAQRESDLARLARLRRSFIVTTLAIVSVGIVLALFFVARTSQLRSTAQAQAMGCLVLLMPNESATLPVAKDGPRGQSALKAAAGDVPPEICGLGLAEVLQSSGRSRPDIIRWAVGLSTLPNAEPLRSKIDRIEAALALPVKYGDRDLNEQRTYEAKLAEADLWSRSDGDMKAAADAVSAASRLFAARNETSSLDGKFKLSDLLLREGQLRIGLRDWQTAERQIKAAIDLQKAALRQSTQSAQPLTRVDRFKLAQSYAALGRMSLMRTAAAQPTQFAMVTKYDALRNPLTREGFDYYQRCRSQEVYGDIEGSKKADPDYQTLVAFCLIDRFKALYRINGNLAESSFDKLFTEGTLDLNAISDADRTAYLDLLKFMADINRKKMLREPDNDRYRNRAGTYGRWVVKVQRDILAGDYSSKNVQSLSTSLNSLAFYYILDKDPKTALATSASACVLDSRNYEIYTTWGLALLLRGNRNAALGMLGRAVQHANLEAVRTLLLRDIDELSKANSSTVATVSAAIATLDGIAADQAQAGQCDDGLNGETR